MTTQAKNASRILEAVHETAQDLHQAGFIDWHRMQHYDALCLERIPPYTSERLENSSPFVDIL